jgi:hypothetical protein
MGSKTFTSRRKPTKPTTGAQTTTTTTTGEHQATQMTANPNRHSKTGTKRSN